MTKYEIIIYWSEEDAAFVADAPGLPGCAAHGPHRTAHSATRRMRFACGSTPRKSLATRFLNRRDAGCSWPNAVASV
jgi:hypothetical protein